jgi:hypothetical protein
MPDRLFPCLCQDITLFNAAPRALLEHYARCERVAPWIRTWAATQAATQTDFRRLGVYP